MKKLLVGEFFLAMGYVAWRDLRAKYVPWPGALNRVGVLFALLAIIAAGSEELASALGAGVFVAQLIQDFGSSKPGEPGHKVGDAWEPGGVPQGLVSQSKSADGTCFPPEHATHASIDGAYSPLYFGSV